MLVNLDLKTFVEIFEHNAAGREFDNLAHITANDLPRNSLPGTRWKNA
jgi:hypothetical protein